MSKINLWGEGFKTENYKILTFSLFNEMELAILTEYFEQFLITEEKKEGEEKKFIKIIDVKKVTDIYKTEEFIEKITSAEKLIYEVLGEDFVKALSFYSYFFLIPSLNFEIIMFKNSLKKK